MDTNNNNALTVYLGRPHNLFQLWYSIKQIFRNLKSAWQRVKRGYSDVDLWNFDIYLEKVISNGLRDLAKQATGYPDKYETFENWQEQLNGIADLVEKFNPDNCIDWEKDDVGIKDWEDADEEAAIAREVVFDWFKTNWGALWD